MNLKTLLILSLAVPSFGQTVEDRVNSLEALHGPETCGNGVLNPGAGEECDDGNLFNDDGCSSICKIEEETLPICGDGLINQSAEECDGTNLNNQSCTTLGFDGGTLSCSSNCTLNTSNCSSEPPPPPIEGPLDEATWTELPNSSMDTVFIPGVDDAFPGNENAFEKIQVAWSGGVCVGEELYVLGGGHGNGPHNGIFAVNVMSGQWRRVTEPSPVWTRETCPLDEVTGLNICEPPIGEPCKLGRCNVGPDGRPVARHTYDLLATDNENIYMSGGSIYWAGNAGTEPRSWMFNLQEEEWSPMPHQNPAAHVSGSLEAIDGELYLVNPNGFQIYNPNTGWRSVGNKESNHTTNITYSPLTDSFYGFGAVNRGWVKTREEFIAGEDIRELPDFIVPELQTDNWIFPELSVKSMDYFGATWYPPTGEILYWDGGPRIIAFDVENESWRVVIPAGDPGPALRNGTFGRFSYCNNRLLVVGVGDYEVGAPSDWPGVDKNLWYLDIPDPDDGGTEPEPPPTTEPPADDLVSLPYYETPPGDQIVVDQCGPISDWDLIEIRTDEEITNWRPRGGERAKIRVYWKDTPYLGGVRTKGMECALVEGIPGPNGELPIVEGVNGTKAFRGEVRRGGLMIRNLIISPGMSVGASSTTGDCIGVPNDQYFLIIIDTKVTQCGHHGFNSNHGHQLYIEIGRSSFSYAYSHLAYIHHNAMAYIYDSEFYSPGWGHALRCIALRCIIENTKVSNVELDGSVAPLGVNPILPNRNYIGMHPLEVFTCGQHEVDVDATLHTSGQLWAASFRSRESFNTCDVGEVVDGQWTKLEWGTDEFMDPDRWATTTDLTTVVKDFNLTCVGPRANECQGWDIKTSYNWADDSQKGQLKNWLKAKTAEATENNTVWGWPELLTALDEDSSLPWWWKWLSGQVLPSFRNSFLRGSLTNKVPLPVPIPGWYQRARIIFEVPVIIRPYSKSTSYCYGVPPVDGKCVEEDEGRSFNRAFIEVR